jgi:Golgi phosphoprotein 3
MTEEKIHILVTNDDGITAPGLLALAREMQMIANEGIPGENKMMTLPEELFFLALQKGKIRMPHLIVVGENNMLTLPEELYLLALHEVKGRVPHSMAIGLYFGLGAAMLAELVLLGKVRLDKHKRVLVVDAMPTGDDVIDEGLEKIQASEHPRKTAHWVQELSSIHKLDKRMTHKLVEKGILYKEEKRYLGVVPYEAYPEQDGTAKYWIKYHLREVALDGGKPEARIVVLLSLVKACEMIDLVFARDEIKPARKKIERLVENEVITQEVCETLNAIMDASTAAIIAATGT